MQSTVSVSKDLILVGGGHSHALVLRKMGMNAWPADVRITLVTNLADTPYSGMLPCHISGLYDFDTAHIDLRPLTRFANCRLMMDEMVGLDAQNQQVLCRSHPPLAYDVLSIDVGSTPTKSKVPGAADYAIPAKPVPDLLKAWNGYLAEIKERAKKDSRTVATISIVGGGVGGVEMAFAMQMRLQQLFQTAGGHKQQVAVHIFQRGAHLAKGRNRLTQWMVERLCKEKGIFVHTGESVCEVKAGAVVCESGLVVECDRIFWVTNASAPPWLQETDLSLTEEGFLAVEDTLQTCSHENIFAAGDVATMVNHQRPKAGVFAVRQGPPLYENLRRSVTGQRLKPFSPQRRYLNIIDTDTERSIASWGPFAVHAKWCRAWKDGIDRKFMGLFSEFPEMETRRGKGERGEGKRGEGERGQENEGAKAYCAGCGSKVGKDVLSRVLSRVRHETSDRDWPARNLIHTGLDTPDDAAIVQVPDGMLAVHTVDQFSALVDDPYVFGQICVNHCLSDLFAMGATSHSVLAIATIPYGTDAKQEETLYQLLSGAIAQLAESKTFLVGGHTTEGADLSLGFSCNGWIDPDAVWRKNNLVPGQALILTKALGTGALFAADMQRSAKGRWIEGAIASMLLSNRAAASCLREYGATACTDVTGFGLAGHLLEMLSHEDNSVSAELEFNQLPMLSGVEQVLEQGFVSSLYERNRQSAMSAIRAHTVTTTHANFPILFDPQTSGGLLASIAPAAVEDCLAALRRSGYLHSCCVGKVVNSPDGRPSIAINPL